MPKRKAAPVPPEPSPEPMDPARMQHGDREGDVVASYSADRICEGKPIRAPFPWRGGLWVCTSLYPNDVAHAYRLTPVGAFARPTTYSVKVCSDGEHSAEAARNDPNGFYHGMTVKHAGSTWVLTGPQITFVPGEVGQATFAAGTADPERESRLDAERVALEFRQRSTKRLDGGRAPIGESPLFGGPAQQSLFEE